ncbi:hypothetical protein [Frigoribacterium sp. VKM Ac-2836]|uniref:hypothetical protein n=1 Tax=Frigoribacterium sp. VKM Ac-2836 TaxID=2739014 RepID=UPI0015646A27|nr:hypothetical protein [Frigoribacterium sp. VKM Ac-2836]NRD27754.1 hypothetical protein [Frigoribacterium sp. VKM Ac-2836]
MSEAATAVDLPALREDVRASQRMLAQFVPENDVLSVDESPNGVLMSCAGGTHRWTGVTTVEYAADFDVDSLYTTMEDALADSSLFTTMREESRWGGDRLVVEDAAGTRYTIRLVPQASKVQIAASSWCFTVQPGQTSGGQF